VERWCLDSGGFTCPGTIFYFTGVIYALAGFFCFILFQKFPQIHIQEFDISKSGNEFSHEEDGKELLISPSPFIDEKDERDTDL
jgi:hypothetical protein